MDPSNQDQEIWCSVQRENVARYLSAQNVAHGEIGEVPAWFVYPVLSIWAIESQIQREKLGWWVLSGDVPTDYCSAAGRGHPRLAMAEIADRWLSEVERSHPTDSHIGSTGLSITLLGLLEKRAKLIKDIVNNESVWEE
jgi:hypothetical protein